MSDSFASEYPCSARALAAASRMRWRRAIDFEWTRRSDRARNALLAIGLSQLRCAHRMREIRDLVQPRNCLGCEVGVTSPWRCCPLAREPQRGPILELE